MYKSPAILTYAQIFNPGDKYLKPTLKANRVKRSVFFATKTINK